MGKDSTVPGFTRGRTGSSPTDHSRPRGRIAASPRRSASRAGSTSNHTPGTVNFQGSARGAGSDYADNADCTVSARVGVAMVPDKQVKRMTLRQLLTHAEKCCRDLIEHVQTNVLNRVSDFRDLSRPVRRRSHYPTLVAVQNALKKLVATNAEAQALADYVSEHLQAIRDHANRERVNRL